MKEFIDQVFEGENFAGKDLSRDRFIGCTFLRCSWTANSLENCRLQGASFLESKLMGVDFTLADAQFLKLSFKNCVLRGCNFTELPLQGTQFLDCDVRECFFTQANLKGGSFRGAKLGGTLFHSSNLEGVDFERATDFEIHPLHNKLKGAKFSRMEALSLLEGLEIELL